MRIAIFSDNFYPEVSGISDSIMTTGRILGELGHEIHFYAPAYKKEEFDHIGLPYKEIDLGQNAAVTRFRAFKYNAGTDQGRGVIPNGLRFLTVRRFAPDIIHTHHIGGVGLEALAAARFLRKPLVGTNHTPIIEFLEYSLIKGKLVQSFISRYDVWYYNHCRLVSSPTKFIFEEMKNFGFNKPSQVVSNPIDVKTFAPATSKKQLKEKYKFTNNTLLYAGRLAKEKNLDVMIKALPAVLKKFPDAILVFGGKGPMENELVKLADSLEVSSSVKFLGYIRHRNDFAEIYNASDIFLMMSTAETQSIATMQAMACEIPVIGVKAWGLMEYIRPDNGILIEPGDKDALAEKIIYLFSNKEEMERLGKGGRKFVEDFAPEKIASKWEGIYRKVLDDFVK